MGHVEGEYLWRSVALNPEGTCITDPTHGRLYNATWIPAPREDLTLAWAPIFSTMHPPSVQRRRNPADQTQNKTNLGFAYKQLLNYNVAFIKRKWGLKCVVMGWGTLQRPFKIVNASSPQPVLYPYFEKDLLRQYGRESVLLPQDLEFNRTAHPDWGDGSVPHPCMSPKTSENPECGTEAGWLRM